MKNKTTARIAQLFGIIALIAVIGFSFGACGGDDTGSGTAPNITTATLPGGAKDLEYSQTLAATGDAPITWSFSGTLPAGLSLDPKTGVISGTPTTEGTSEFSVKATNATGSNTKQISITIIILDIEMAQIQAGTFSMGSPVEETGRYSDETRHQVTLAAFSMGKYQVTQAQYAAVMGSNPSNFKAPVSPETGTADRPAEQVSWYDALVFCNKLSMIKNLTPAYEMEIEEQPAEGAEAETSTDPAKWGAVPTGSNPRWDAVTIKTGSNGYRLPTEAQWEYACRAGTTTAYNTGAAVSETTGWYRANSGSRTHGVGEKTANAWALSDMHGNVWEWCWDWYGAYESEDQTNPVGAETGTSRVNRGGSWGRDGRYLRSAYRNGDSPNSGVSDWSDPDPADGANVDFIGFRLVRP